MEQVNNYIIEHVITKYITNTYPDDQVKSAVYDYVAGYTTAINDILRKGNKCDKITKLLDSAFAKTGFIDVYRTVDWGYMENIHGITKDTIHNFVGSIITNKGYMSASYDFKSPWGDRWTNGELVFHITSDKLYPYIAVNDIFGDNEIDCTSQNECILPRNTQLIIKDISIMRNRVGTYLIEAVINV